jgi:hypothetical protein
MNDQFDHVPIPEPKRGSTARYTPLYEALMTAFEEHRAIRIPHAVLSAEFGRIKYAMSTRAWRDGYTFHVRRAGDAAIVWLTKRTAIPPIQGEMIEGGG